MELPAKMEEARDAEGTKDGPSSHASPLNEEIVDELREMMGATFVVAIDAFLADTPSCLAALREAATDGETTTLENLAHTLQGCGGILGALGLVVVCQDLVQHCRAGTLDDAMQKVERIATEYGRVQAVLTTIRHEQVA